MTTIEPIDILTIAFLLLCILLALLPVLKEIRLIVRSRSRYKLEKQKIQVEQEKGKICLSFRCGKYELRRMNETDLRENIELNGGEYMMTLCDFGKFGSVCATAWIEHHPVAQD